VEESESLNIRKGYCYTQAFEMEVEKEVEVTCEKCGHKQVEIVYFTVERLERED
jgi:hypothetical protein